MPRKELSPPRGAGGLREVAVGGDDGAQHNRPCPPRCALAARWPRYRELTDPHATFPRSARLFFELVGIAADPAPPEQWAPIVAAVAEAAGPLEVARGLEMAARQPPMAPHPYRGSSPRWWREADQERAAALAVAWRNRAQGVRT